MSTFSQAQERDMVLFVGVYRERQKQALRKLSDLLGRPITPLVLVDATEPKPIKYMAKDNKAIVIDCDFSSATAIQKILLPYQDRLLAATCLAEKNVTLLRKVIPHVPYINTPTELSLEWTTDKIRMRQLLKNYDKSIAPKFIVVHDAASTTMDQIEKRVGYPLIVKPAGLASSFLVSICYHREELETTLQKTIQKIDAVYKARRGRGEPQILVEEFMEGTIYTTDCYVNQRGNMYAAPFVHTKTGFSVGRQDFYGYTQTTPVILKPHKVEAGRRVAEKAIEALGLRSVTCHVELMKTEDGWKVIEVGPRIGGFRHDLYELAYGFDHSLNDLLIRIPKKPMMAKKARGYATAMKFYPEHKGRLITIDGINKAKKLDSFEIMEIIKKPGDMCDFARNGDDPALTITLFNKTRSNLLADIRRLEKTIHIKVQRPKRLVSG